MRISLLILAAFGALCAATPAAAQAILDVDYRLPSEGEVSNQRLVALVPVDEPVVRRVPGLSVEIAGARLVIGAPTARVDSFGRDWLPGEPLRERRKARLGPLLSIPFQPWRPIR